MGRTTIRQERDNSDVVCWGSLLLETRQHRDRNPSGVRAGRAVLRSCRRRVHDEGTISHQVVGRRNKRRQRSDLSLVADQLLFRFLRRAAVMRLHRVTTLTRSNSRNRIVNHISSDCAIAAPEQAATGHPDRDAEGQQQTNHFVREEPTHSARSLLPASKRYKRSPRNICIVFVPFVAQFCNRSLVSLEHREKT